ncbi:MAG: amidohydrolase [Gammaproteobacteria bacterium]|nr:amidohydrolase [Gammaproteobacteria bacterium]
MQRCSFRRVPLALAGLLAVTLLGCGGDEAPASAKAKAPEADKPFPSTYEPMPSEAMLITNATLFTGTGEKIENGQLLIQDGRIAAVGSQVDAPEGVKTLDAKGKFVTPGIIDVHSHLGDYPSPGVDAHADGNEMTSPNTAEVWAEHSVWPQDPGFMTALAGGVTSLQVLPGSANLFGGRGVTLKNVPGQSVMDMKFPGAPHGLKMACGENPKRVYGSKGRSPSTRMGNVAGYRNAWIDAEEYLEKLEAAERGEGEPPKRDLALETLAGVLKGEILIHNHCYRADEMLVMLDIADEFGYKVGTFHHAVEAYKIGEELAEAGTCAAMWADWWGFKMEAFDGVRENVPLVDSAGACAIVHSDSEVGIQRLNQEAAKAMAAANRAGMDIKPEQAMRWLTINAAKSLGIADQTGSLETGKMADIVIWSGSPFSVYSQAEQVFIDGALAYDRNDPAFQPKTDFEIGIIEVEGQIQ